MQDGHQASCNTCQQTAPTRSVTVADGLEGLAERESNEQGHEQQAEGVGQRRTFVGIPQIGNEHQRCQGWNPITVWQTREQTEAEPQQGENGPQRSIVVFVMVHAEQIESHVACYKHTNDGEERSLMRVKKVRTQAAGEHFNDHRKDAVVPPCFSREKKYKRYEECHAVELMANGSDRHQR